MLFAASFTVYVTVVTPTGNTVPGVCDLVQTKLPDAVQLSVAVGSVHETVAVQTPAPLVRDILDGHPLITGFCVSLTVTVNVQVAVFGGVAPSETITLTVVIPTLKVFVPICPVPLRVVTPVVLQAMLAVEQLSEAVIAGTATLAVQTLLVLPTTILSGQVTVGLLPKGQDKLRHGKRKEIDSSDDFM